MTVLKLRFKRFLILIGDPPQVIFRTARFFANFYRGPLGQVVGHAVALFVGRCAVEVITALSFDEQHDRAQWLALIADQQDASLFSFRETFKTFPVIGLRMDSEGVTVTGQRHQLMEHRRVIAFFDRQVFFLGKTDVIARLLIHPGQQVFLAAIQRDHDGPRRLDSRE